MKEQVICLVVAVQGKRLSEDRLNISKQCPWEEKEVACYCNLNLKIFLSKEMRLQKIKLHATILKAVVLRVQSFFWVCKNY